MESKKQEGFMNLKDCPSSFSSLGSYSCSILSAILTESSSIISTSSSRSATGSLLMVKFKFSSEFNFYLVPRMLKEKLFCVYSSWGSLLRSCPVSAGFLVVVSMSSS